MKKVSGLVLVCLGMLILGCTDQSKQREVVQATFKKASSKEIFENYLVTHHQLALAAEGHHYILIPRMGCTGCFKSVLGFLAEELSQEHAEDFTFISSSSKLIPPRLDSTITIYRDRSGVLDQLDLRIANVTIVSVKAEGQITVQSVKDVAELQTVIPALKAAENLK